MISFIVRELSKLCSKLLLDKKNSKHKKNLNGDQESLQNRLGGRGWGGAVDLVWLCFSKYLHYILYLNNIIFYQITNKNLTKYIFFFLSLFLQLSVLEGSIHLMSYLVVSVREFSVSLLWQSAASLTDPEPYTIHCRMYTGL